MNKKFATSIMIFLLTVSCVGTSFAQSKEKTEKTSIVIWNESTGETTIYDDYKDIPSKVTIDKTNKNSNKYESMDDTNITIRSYMPVLDHYELDDATIDYKAEYVGSSRVDNSDNPYTNATVIFTASDNDEFEIEGSTSLETEAELDLILTEVKGSVEIGATARRSWKKGTTYGTSLTVPPGKIGKIKAYIPGTHAYGDAVYKVYNTTNGSYTYSSVGRGALVPAEDEWNFVTSVK